MNSRETFNDLAIRAVFMVAVYVVFAAMLPSYHTLRGAAALLDGAVLIGLTALGIGITMIAGEFDLSVGSLAAVIGVFTINLIVAGMNVAPAIAIGVLAAAVFGALQGFVIALTGINSLVFTIGTLIGLRGFALIISNENSVTVPIPRLGETDFLAERFFGLLSPLSILMFGVFFLAHLFLRYTVWGREIFAIGGGRAEARAAGVSIMRPMVISFALSATLAGLAGAVSSVRLASATPLGFRYASPIRCNGLSHRGNRARGREGYSPRDSDWTVYDEVSRGRRGEPWRPLLVTKPSHRNPSHFRARGSVGRHGPSGTDRSFRAGGTLAAVSGGAGEFAREIGSLSGVSTEALRWSLDAHWRFGTRWSGRSA